MKLTRLLPVLLAASAAIPGIVLHLMGVTPTPPVAALVSGAAILGASFLLLWACDAAQSDISQALALAVVALIAVLPEYAVDMYFTWQAGQDPASDYAHYAIANMTGANRLLIGVAWGAIALLFWVRFRRPVRLGPDRRLELVFLGAATAYAFVIPLKGTLAWYDGVVFLGLYVWYLTLAARRPTEEAEAIGPAALIIALPKAKRRMATLALFLFAAGTILANAEIVLRRPDRHGQTLGINEFLLVQWLAPIASEAPEFVVALVFAWRGQANLALGSLLSSKLNQWTLLVGMIPGVFALSHGSLDHPIPMGSRTDVGNPPDGGPVDARCRLAGLAPADVERRPAALRPLRRPAHPAERHRPVGHRVLRRWFLADSPGVLASLRDGCHGAVPAATGSCRPSPHPVPRHAGAGEGPSVRLRPRRLGVRHRRGIAGSEVPGMRMADRSHRGRSPAEAALTARHLRRQRQSLHQIAARFG